MERPCLLAPSNMAVTGRGSTSHVLLEDRAPGTMTTLTRQAEPGGCWGAAWSELDLAGVDYNAVIGVEVAGADNAGGAVALHQQVVGVGGLAGFHLDAPALGS